MLLRKSTAILLALTLVLLVPLTHAADYTTMNLPPVPLPVLGRDNPLTLKFLPMANSWPQAVGMLRSNFGMSLLVGKLALLKATIPLWSLCRFRPMANFWPRPAGVAQF